MNKKYIIGGLIVAVFLAIGIFSLNSNTVAYADIATAKTVAKKVQIKGNWIKEKGADYDSKNNVFSFHMHDDKGSQVKVIYNNSRPNNFEIAESIVVKGRIENGVLHADHILTKCPSKYEGNADQLKQTSM